MKMAVSIIQETAFAANAVSQCASTSMTASTAVAALVALSSGTISCGSKSSSLDLYDGCRIYIAFSFLVQPSRCTINLFHLSMQQAYTIRNRSRCIEVVPLS